MKNQKPITVEATVNTFEMDQAIEKAEHLNEVLKEAKSLINELASMAIKLEVNVQI